MLWIFLNPGRLILPKDFPVFSYPGRAGWAYSGRNLTDRDLSDRTLLALHFFKLSDDE